MIASPEVQRAYQNFISEDFGDREPEIRAAFYKAVSGVIDDLNKKLADAYCEIGRIRRGEGDPSGKTIGPENRI